MTRVVLVTLSLFLSSCALLHGAFGFPVTRDALHCGQQYGMDVWVDGQTSDELPPMTCQEALETVQLAHLYGVDFGWWPMSHTWDYRVEFINAHPLTVIDSLGSDHAAGYTLTWISHVSAVSYWYDAHTKDPKPSCVILLHEMLHMKEGGNAGHCHWTSKYRKFFDGLENGAYQGWHDNCED